MVESCEGEEKKIVIPKKECEFEFYLGENERIIVNGKDFLRKPEERVKEFRK
jgi:RNase P/RNase MRP subunit p29